MQDSWLEQQWKALALGVQARLGLPGGSVTARHVAALWLLCQLQATLGNNASAACSLFTAKVPSTAPAMQPGASLPTPHRQS